MLFKVAGYADKARAGGAGAVTPQAPGLPATLPYPEGASARPRWFAHCEPRAPLLPPLPAADGAPTRAMQSLHCQLLAPLLAPAASDGTPIRAMHPLHARFAPVLACQLPLAVCQPRRAAVRTHPVRRQPSRHHAFTQSGTRPNQKREICHLHYIKSISLLPWQANRFLHCY